MQRHALSAVTKSYEQHMERLANIAKRDMGNAVQKMFATLMLWREKSLYDKSVLKIHVTR